MTPEQIDAALGTIKDWPVGFLSDDWSEALRKQLKPTDFEALRALRSFLRSEFIGGKTVYPPVEDMFAALWHTPLKTVRALILGQDPYHGPGQANGLSFSVRIGVSIPPSLKNIIKVLQRDIGPQPDHGSLVAWAKRGVLLLNTVLSVEAGKPLSHANKGWECFTDAVLRTVNERREPVVFILWGGRAQKKSRFVDSPPHHILKASHPSGRSAWRSFLISKPFLEANSLLTPPLDWNLDWPVTSKVSKQSHYSGKIVQITSKTKITD